MFGILWLCLKSLAYARPLEAQDHDFLGIRIWQPQEDELSRPLQELASKLLSHAKLGMRNRQGLSAAGNAALVVIKAVYDRQDYYFIAPYIFLNKIFGVAENKGFYNIRIAADNLPAMGVWLKYQQLNHIRPGQIFSFMPVYHSTDDTNQDEQNYRSKLQQILRGNPPLPEPHLKGFQHVFREEVENETVDKYWNEFPLNWLHSEQGILEWLESVKSHPQEEPLASKILGYTNGADCTLYIFTYRDMCQRCSTTCLLEKERIKETLKANSLKIASIGRKEHNDVLWVPQRLGAVLASQNDLRYNGNNFITRMIG